MKVQILGAALTLLLAAPAFTQPAARADIPFAFHAAGTNLPAGEYRVSRVGVTNSAWRIRAVEGGPAVYIATAIGVVAKEVPETGALIFNRYGNTYFLRQVRFAGQTSGWELPASKLEKEYAKARSQVDTASVVLFTESPR
jgi:hypothetical protein